MSRLAEALRARVSGLLRGRDLAGEVLVLVDDEALRLDTTLGRVTIPYGRLDGLRLVAAEMELFVSGGDALLFSESAALPELAHHLVRRVCMLPELTRSLRAMGSARAMPGPEHDEFYNALLDARRTAEHAAAPDAIRAAFDAPGLRAAVSQRLREFAAARYQKQPPERRALEAALLDEAEAFLARLALLERAQAALDASAEAERFARWREWSSTLRGVFEEADACWISLCGVLRTEAPPRARRRRRGDSGADE